MTQAELSDMLVRLGSRVLQRQTRPAEGKFPPWFRVDADCPGCGGGMTVRLVRKWVGGKEGDCVALCRCGWSP